MFWSQRAIVANGRQNPYFSLAGSSGARTPRTGTDPHLQAPWMPARLMRILIVLTSRHRVNNKILISAYWIAFFCVGVSKKFIVINVSQEFIP